MCFPVLDQLKEHLKSCGLASACKIVRTHENEDNTAELQMRVGALCTALGTSFE